MSINIDLQQRYQVLKSTLIRIGYFRRGSLVKRFMVCGKPTCACHASPPRLHGPYYQWTRKIHGKTVTVLFTREQADLLADWIAAGRELDRIIAQMERLSLLATDLIPRPSESVSGERAPTTSVTWSFSLCLYRTSWLTERTIC